VGEACVRVCVCVCVVVSVRGCVCFVCVWVCVVCVLCVVCVCMCVCVVCVGVCVGVCVPSAECCLEGEFESVECRWSVGWVLMAIVVWVETVTEHWLRVLEREVLRGILSPDRGLEKITFRGALWSVRLTKYLVDQIEKNEMDGACSTYGEEGCIQGFGGET